jgi:hypothetical protein
MWRNSSSCAISIEIAFASPDQLASEMTFDGIVSLEGLEHLRSPGATTFERLNRRSARPAHWPLNTRIRGLAVNWDCRVEQFIPFDG